MLYLLLCIALTALLFLQFRLHPQWRMRTLQVVAVNYAVCVLCGLTYEPTWVTEVWANKGVWLWLAALQGFMFFSIFSLTGVVTQRFGLGYASLVAKVSVVIPLLISVYVFNERMIPLQWAGVAFALIAIALVHMRFLQKNTVPLPELILWGSLLFLGSGIVDTNFKVYDSYFSKTISGVAFTSSTFAFAAFFGLLYISLQFLRGGEVFTWRNVGGGFLLGVPNFFSVLALVKALQVLPGSTFYPINNIGLLVVANLIGVLFFLEKPGWAGWTGLALAVTSIVLILA